MSQSAISDRDCLRSAISGRDCLVRAMFADLVAKVRADISPDGLEDLAQEVGVDLAEEFEHPQSFLKLDQRHPYLNPDECL